jgi:hypothetical protein
VGERNQAFYYMEPGLLHGVGPTRRALARLASQSIDISRAMLPIRRDHLARLTYQPIINGSFSTTPSLHLRIRAVHKLSTRRTKFPSNTYSETKTPTNQQYFRVFHLGVRSSTPRRLPLASSSSPMPSIYLLFCLWTSL